MSIIGRGGAGVVVPRRAPYITPRATTSSPSGGGGAYGLVGFQSWAEVDGVTYGAEPDLLGPIGGYEGYTGIITSGDYTASTKADIQSALDGAAAGETVFVPSTASVDLSAGPLTIPAGVTLASDRGAGGNAGALLFSTSKTTHHIIEPQGNDIRITGFRLKGHDDYATAGLDPATVGNAAAIKQTTGSNLEVDNCEILNWTHAGIALLDRNADGHHCHHNYIHHVWPQSDGYGIVMDQCGGTHEFNLFDAIRHAVSHTGRNPVSNSANTGSGELVVQHNVVLGQITRWQFDMRSSPEDAGTLGNDDGGRCGVLRLTNNYQLAVTDHEGGGTRAVAKIRGTPHATGSEYTRNWINHPTTWAIVEIFVQLEDQYSEPPDVAYNANLWDGDNKVVRTSTAIDDVAPTFDSAVVEDATPSVVEVTFSEAVNSPSMDYAAGVTITVAGSPATISSAARQTVESKIDYTLASPVAQGQAVTWAYDSATGDIEDQASSPNPLADVAAQTVTNNVGFYDFPLQAGARAIYVSSSQGSDSNDGLSTGAPLATIAAGYTKLRDGYPDHLYMRRGDTFNEGFPNVKKSSGNSAHPLLFGAYGSGARPHLITPTSNHGCKISGTYNRIGIAFVSLEMEPAGHLQNYTRYGFQWQGDGDYITLFDMYIHHYDTNVSFSAYNTDGTDFVTIRRCVIADSWSAVGHSQGVYAAYLPNLTLEDNVFDHNGWNDGVTGAEPTDFNHNAYITGGVTVTARNNIFARASATGMQARGGGVVEDNLFVANAVGLNYGLLFGGTHPAGGVTGNVTDNVILDHVDRAEVNGHWGIGMANIGDAGCMVDNNLILRFQSGIGIAASGEAGVNDGAKPLQNTIYQNNHIIDAFDGIKFTGENGVALVNLTFNNNIWKRNDRSIVYRDDSPGQSWSGNTWYTTGIYVDELNGTHDFAWWQTNHEPDAVLGDSSYHARDVPGYHASIGGTETLEAFLTEARKQSKDNWRTEYTAAAVNAWIRNG